MLDILEDCAVQQKKKLWAWVDFGCDSAPLCSPSLTWGKMLRQPNSTQLDSLIWSDHPKTNFKHDVCLSVTGVIETSSISPRGKPVSPQSFPSNFPATRTTTLTCFDFSSFLSWREHHFQNSSTFMLFVFLCLYVFFLVVPVFVNVWVRAGFVCVSPCLCVLSSCLHWLRFLCRQMQHLARAA